MIRTVLSAFLAAASAAALAQVPVGNSAPQPVPYVDPIPQPRDVPYPGVIQLQVDATDVTRGIWRVRETIPVPQAGRMTLLYPKFLPGNHAPRGEIEKLASLVVRGNGQVIPWTRDPVDVYAFHLDVPQGVQQLDVSFDFLSATKPDQGRVVATPAMLSLQPERVSLYPAGYFVRQIPVRMTVRYPEGWTAVSAVPAQRAGATYTYNQVNYETLVDSPIVAGRHYKEWALSPRVDLNVWADTAAELEAKPDQIEAHRRLVDQSLKAFGARHYDRYEFLLTISDQLGGIGLEHHRSSENGVNPGYFTDWENSVARRNLLPHEFAHSWDGKFRRGADQWAPDYRTPTRNSLLWVYEGQTQFWGYVLQARSGIVSKQDTLDAYALIAANLQNAVGREWRPLLDTTNDPIISARRPKGWSSWQRSEDYYNEGLLIWMEVDAILRRESRGRRSIDDFAKALFGIRDGDWGVVTYTFEDVAETLNRIQPYDWAGFLRTRITETGKPAPVNGFEMNGYRLVYTAEPTGYFSKAERARNVADLSYSIGLVLNREGEVTASIWNSPAYRAGLDVGTVVSAVNGQTYSADRLKAAVVAAKGTRDPIRLLVRSQDGVREVAVDYHDGPRYPRLQKVGTGEAGLDRLLSAR
ncbi:M61 family metallopeptidase [Sphingomonas lenta]|uniref:Peptidase M61 n=1 Tax=Sphingomonas lenta TaxID=1141887 RepID=A0A2A2SCJ4_9SPHN|nr:M61 family metallopeptidase [Sphingomonas lenta]PAX06933.1 peptidase M61 [Sphingomonas lenta]